jgi:cobalamin biosynthesis Mg chelatase CobN
MPAKSRRKRGKNLPPSKRIKKSATGSAAVVAQSETQPVDSAPAANVPVSGKKNVAAQVQAQAISHQYVSSELVTIAVITVVIFVILVILAAVF